MENMEEETNLIKDIDYSFDIESCNKLFGKCCEITKDENGTDIKIIYMDKFYHPVPKEQASIKLVNHLNDNKVEFLK